MNSVFRSTARMALAQTRSKSTVAGTEHAFMKARLNQDSFKKTWLSDPSTYPIFVVVGGAVTLCAGTMAYYITSCKDVTVAPEKRNSIIRTWGQNPGRFGN